MSIFDFLDQATAWQWIGIIVLVAIIADGVQGLINRNRKP